MDPAFRNIVLTVDCFNCASFCSKECGLLVKIFFTFLDIASQGERR